MAEIKDSNYINIQGWMRTKLNLTDNKLIMFAIIFGFSQDGVTRCKASLSYLQTALGKTRKTVIATREELINSGLIIMHNKNQTSVTEYEVNHNFIASVKTIPPNLIASVITPTASVKTPLVLGEKLHQASGKITPNNNIYNNNIIIEDNNNKKYTKKIKPQKHKHGEYKNVLLSDEELEKLKTRFVDYEKRIKQLDEGIELKGYKYKSHYLAIIKWAEKDKPQIEAKQFKFNKEIV
jgi:hypothetical protein